MTKREWLKRARIIDKEIRQLNIARQEAYEMAVSTTTNMSREKVLSSKGNATEKKLMTLLEYDLIISEQKDKLLRYKTEILKAINSVDNDLYRTLLTAYYVNCKTWEEVAGELNYDLGRNCKSFMDNNNYYYLGICSILIYF